MNEAENRQKVIVRTSIIGIGANISRASSIALILMLLLSIVGMFLPARKK